MTPKDKWLITVAQNREEPNQGLVRLTNMVMEHEPTLADIMRIQRNQSYPGVNARVVGWQRVQYGEDDKDRGGAEWDR